MACNVRQDCPAEKDAIIERLQKTIVDADLQLAALEKEVDRLNQDLTLLQSSTSWRLTKPVRKIKTLVQKFHQMFRYQRHRVTLMPHDHTAQETDGNLHIIGNGFQFTVTTPRKKYPAGMVRISGRILPVPAMCPELYIADENGFSADNSVVLISDNNGRINQEIRLPDEVHGLRLDILEYQGQCTIDKVTIIETGTAHVLIRRLWSNISAGFLHPGQTIKHVQKGVGFYRQNGFTATFRRITGPGTTPDYQKWIKASSTITADDRIQMENHIEKMGYKPLISIIMPVYNTPKRLLMAAIESVRNQIYPNWELCIADDASTLPYIRVVLEECSRMDSRIKVVFRPENGHISACSNSALALVTGEFTALLDHDDKLAPHALYMIADELNRFPDADIIYSDEDKIDHQGQRFSPHFKPDWNPELFFSINYLSHLGVYRTAVIRSVNGFRKGMEGSQDYDLVLRCLLHTTPEKIRHIPHILYHWRATEGSTALSTREKQYATDAGVQALTDYFHKVDPDIRVTACEAPTTYRIYYPVKTEPTVCLIIPTKNNHKMLQTCLDSITEKTDYTNYTLMIVNNQSDDPDTLAYLHSLAQNPKCRVLEYNHAFNYSAINNYAVKQTQSDLVCLVNDDIEVISPKWLGEMVSYAIRPDIGAVGAKLLYPNNSIQHGGVILGLGGVAGHSHKHTDTTRGGPGYFHRLMLPQAISAVTGACLLVRRQVYEQVGGLDAQHLKIAFNDVDFCLRVRQAGFRNVWTPFALLYHHESVSRGYEDTREKQERFSKEVAYMKKKWGPLLKNDPSYNPNLTTASEDFALGFPSRAKKPWQGQSSGKCIVGLDKRG